MEIIDKSRDKVLTGFMLRVKSFNEKHKKIAKVTTVLALIVVTLLSILFRIAGAICSVFSPKAGKGKRNVGILLALLLLLIVILVVVFGHRNTAVTEEKTLEVAKTQDVGEKTKAEDVIETQVTQTDDVIETEVAETEVTDTEVTETEVTDTEVSETEKKGTEIIETEVSKDGEAADSESDFRTINYEYAGDTITFRHTNTSSNTSVKSPAKEWDTSDEQLDEYMEKYPETVGWIYFEDGHISYPIMQAADNKKYKKLGYTGDEAWTGAIFLDYRSSSDFSDYNSIVYGHNMKDKTMFGSLRDYRENPRYYDNHQYFQVITKDKKYRYQIFCYMDVPVSYVIYDYVGDAAYEFVKDAEPVRIKSYMDSYIVVNETKKVVTLSTCTDKDDLQFVVLGVMVDEADRD